jgi:hypothetical protein
MIFEQKVAKVAKERGSEENFNRRKGGMEGTSGNLFSENPVLDSIRDAER